MDGIIFKSLAYLLVGIVTVACLEYYGRIDFRDNNSFLENFCESFCIVLWPVVWVVVALCLLWGLLMYLVYVVKCLVLWLETH